MAHVVWDHIWQRLNHKKLQQDMMATANHPVSLLVAAISWTVQCVTCDWREIPELQGRPCVQHPEHQASDRHHVMLRLAG